MAQLSEQNIIDNAYYLIEKGSEKWDTASDEYLTARGLANIAVGRYEFYEQTKWIELWTTLTDATDGTKTVTKGTSSYSCPTNMRYPASFVRIVDSSGNSSYWQVIPVARMALYANSSDRICYFTGSIKSGFKLHFNPNVSLTTGDTINYEYYKQATKFTAITDTTEMQDPYFISYYIASHMSEEGVDPNLYAMAEARLEQMRTQNMSQLYGVSEDIPDSLDHLSGFGV